MLDLRVRSTAFGWATIFAFGLGFDLSAVAVGAGCPTVAAEVAPASWAGVVFTTAPTTVLAGSSTAAPPIAVMAPSALTRPAPTAAGEFTLVNGVAEDSSAERIEVGVASGCVWRSSAATAAACGAASEVPQKCQPSERSEAKKVVEAQSVAVT